MVTQNFGNLFEKMPQIILLYDDNNNCFLYPFTPTCAEGYLNGDEHKLLYKVTGNSYTYS
jgi:hypothetical protein